MLPGLGGLAGRGGPSFGPNLLTDTWNVSGGVIVDGPAGGKRLVFPTGSYGVDAVQYPAVQPGSYRLAFVATGATHQVKPYVNGSMFSMRSGANEIIWQSGGTSTTVEFYFQFTVEADLTLTELSFRRIL